MWAVCVMVSLNQLFSCVGINAARSSRGVHVLHQHCACQQRDGYMLYRSALTVRSLLPARLPCFPPSVCSSISCSRTASLSGT